MNSKLKFLQQFQSAMLGLVPPTNIRRYNAVTTLQRTFLDILPQYLIAREILVGVKIFLIPIC